MIETINVTDTGTLAVSRSAQVGWTADLKSDQGPSVEYYRAYYRALVETHASRCEGRRGLEAIKIERRKARRENG